MKSIHHVEGMIMREFPKPTTLHKLQTSFQGLSAEPPPPPCKQGKYFYVQANVLCNLCESHVHSPACPYHHLLRILPVITSMFLQILSILQAELKIEDHDKPEISPDKCCTSYPLVQMISATTHSKLKAYFSLCSDLFHLL